MENKNIENIPSILLSNQENEYLFQLLGHKIKCRSTAVVEMYGTSLPHHINWDYRYCGVAVFVKDFSRRSFFIQVYDIEVGKKLFEQEIYEDFYYSVNPLFFHQFESENEIIGLNFASEEEADHFGSAIVKFSERKRLKKSVPDADIITQKEKNEKSSPRKLKTHKSFRKSKKKLNTRRLSKSQIGVPENFRHLQHVGLDRGGESPTENIVACFIDMSNLKDKQPEVIYNEVEIIDETPSIKISPPSYPSASKPQKHLQKKSSSVSPKRNPPILPLGPKPNLNFNRSVSSPEEASVNPLLPDISQSVPPPPPLPGMQMKPKIIKQRSEDSASTQTVNRERINNNMNIDFEESSSRSDLLQQIRNPALKLKHNMNIDFEEPSSRSDLLQQIRNPALKLKHVDVKKQEKILSSSTSCIMNSLAKTLDDRSFAFRGDSDESDSDSSNSYDDDDDDSDW